MTDVEMSLSHKDKDIEMCLAKFDSDKDSNGATETPETDPLALDDEEKMELEEEGKDADVETKESRTNGTQIVEISLPSPNDRSETESSDPETQRECTKQAEELPVTEQPKPTPIVKEPEKAKAEVFPNSLPKQRDVEEDIPKEIITIFSKPVTEKSTETKQPVETNECVIADLSLKNKIEECLEDRKATMIDKIKKNAERRDKIVEIFERKKETKKLQDTEFDKLEKTVDKHLEDVPSLPLLKAKEENVDQPQDLAAHHPPEVFNQNKQEACTSGDSDVDVDDVPLQIAEDTEKKQQDNGFCKRRNTESDPIKSGQCPSKKLCQELQDTFDKHNTMLFDYMSNTSNNSVEEIDRHTENLISEIETLKELASTKEIEWNNILHLRKVKEEILLRLIRRKKIMLLDKVNHDIAKNNMQKKFLTGNKNLVKDKYDEVSNLSMSKNFPNLSGINQPGISSPMMLPASSLPYCPTSMPNFGIDKNINYYGNKKIVPKPIVMMPGPRPGIPSYHQMADRNGLLDSYGMPMGRQGPIKDVQSIIADYRQRHPEVVPRRGRRMKSLLNPQTPQIAVGPRPIAPHPQDHSMDLGLLLGRMEGNPHMSISEALASQQSSMLGQNVPTSLHNGMSFKDVLVQFANLTSQQQQSGGPSGGMGGPSGLGGMGGMAPGLPPPPPYPEVTLHPVNNPQCAKVSQNQQNNSLLHGILTKSQSRQDNSRFSTFSPTLARLLTAPEKVVTPNTLPTSTSYTPQKNCMEITITPVPPGSQNNRNEPEVVQLDDFEEAELDEDTADRPLVIDESMLAGGGQAGGAEVEAPLEVSESEVPECQGCHRKEAQFVCAGCANQWYCSRECQVSSWDEHSEVCSG